MHCVVGSCRGRISQYSTSKWDLISEYKNHVMSCDCDAMECGACSKYSNYRRNLLLVSLAQNKIIVEELCYKFVVVAILLSYTPLVS